MHVFDQALRDVAPYLDRYGYFAVFAAVYLEGVGIPAPGVTLMVAAGLAAGRGAMALPLVAVTAAAAALLGFNSGYWLGRAGGHGLLRLPYVNRRNFERLHRLFARWGVAVVAIAPFLDGLRQLNGYAAGLARMPWRRYVLADLVGVAGWVALWCVLSYETGRHARVLYRVLHVGHVTWYLAAAGAAAVLAAFLFWRHRHERQRSGGDLRG